MADERIRAELQLENSQFLAALNASEAETSDFMRALGLFEGEERRSAAATQSLTEALRSLSVEEIKLVEAERQATTALQAETAQTQVATAAKRNLATATDAAAVAKRNFGSTVLFASYAVQDFTSQLSTRGLAGALSAIQNNIPQILVGLGVGGGFAGVASLAAVAAQSLAAGFGAMGEKAGEAAKQLETLKEKADKLREAPGAKEKEKAATYAEYLGLTDRDTISAGIEASLTGDAQQKAQAAAEYLAEREMIPGTEAYAARMTQRGGRRINVEDSVRQSLAGQRADIQRQRDELLVGLSEGQSGAVRRVTGMARARAGLFPRGLADDLDSLTPEAQAAAEAEAEAADEFGRRASRGAAGRRRFNQQGDELTRAGWENEAAMWRQGQGEREAERKDVVKATESIRESMDRWLEKTAQPSPRAERAREAWAAGRAVQEESMQMYGQEVDINTAIQIARQRSQQANQLQMEAVNTILGTQQDFAAELAQARQQLQWARRLQQANRTQQNMGGN